MSNTVSLTVRINADDKKRLEEIANSQERSLSFIVNKAIKEYLQKYTNDETRP